MPKKKGTSSTVTRKSSAKPAVAAKDAAIGSVAKGIGARLRDLRTQRNMSQGDIEGRTGLLRCYVSRVENGWTVPSVETLEKFAAALAVPLHMLFYRGEGTPAPLGPLSSVVQVEREAPDPLAQKLRRLVAKMDTHERQTLFSIVRKLTVMGA